MNTVNNPLRQLRESIDPNRLNFARRYRLCYSTVTSAELGLTAQPIHYVEALSALTGTPAQELLQQYSGWRGDVAERDLS